MTYFVGLDVSVQETAVCVVDDVGKVICERKVPTEADDIAALLSTIGEDYVWVGIEAGPLSQWRVNGLTETGLPVVCVERKWSHKSGRSGKMYPTPTNGYENDEATEFFRQI
ncbi:MAG: hypothetical protein HRU33_03465 [Rhodobacteraceae bacterium]|nr:hypothetical protein [Paracoccaceae bacterium]